jgi:hypothetical protein
MYYINTNTATEDHKFTDGDESELIPATDLNAAFFKLFQSELQNVVLNGGLVLNPSDDGQVWKVIEKLGLKSIVSNDATVNIGNYKGGLLIIHNPSDFTLSSTIYTNSPVVIIPMWADGSPESFNFVYNGQILTIKKGQMIIGWALNLPGVGTVQMAALAIPVFFSGKMELGNVNASSLKTSKFLDAGLVSFEFSNDADPELGMPEWKAWQIAENWKLGQVKRVYCSNVNTVRKVPVFYDANSNWKHVSFYKNSYREFICIGTRTVTEDEISRTYAVLLVDGGSYTESQTESQT